MLVVFIIVNGLKIIALRYVRHKRSGAIKAVRAVLQIRAIDYYKIFVLRGQLEQLTDLALSWTSCLRIILLEKLIMRKRCNDS